jgi:hypothetical protein
MKFSCLGNGNGLLLLRSPVGIQEEFRRNSY